MEESEKAPSEPLLCFLGSALLYTLLAAYIQEVRPKAVGIRRHPLFFLSREFWLGAASGHLGGGVHERSDDSDVELMGSARFRKAETGPLFEPSGREGTPHVHIRGLRKVELFRGPPTSPAPTTAR